MATPCCGGGNPANVAGSLSSTASTQVKDNQNWMRLSLSINLHGTEGMKQLMHNIFKDKNELHLWLASARKYKKCNLPPHVWEKLLGACNGGCPPNCVGETDLEQLDITALHSIFRNLEHIIPPTAMSKNDILLLKQQFEVHVKSIQNNRNSLAHHSLKTSLSNGDFKIRWILIRNALYGIGYKKIKQFDDLKTCSLDAFNLKDEVMVIKDTLEILKEENCKQSVAFKSLEQLIDIKIQECKNQDSFVLTELSDMKGNILARNVFKIS